MAENGRTKVIASIAASIAVLIALLVFIYFVSTYLSIPFQWSRFANAILVAAIVYVIIRIISRFLNGYFSKFTDRSKIHPLTFLLNIFGYFVMAVAVLAMLGVNVSSLILGGSLITVVIGLASQTVLANQFAGILLTVTRPFRIGDLVTINTWQYGGTYPTVFPKYFSVDRIEATAYTGTVEDITINYTVMTLVSGDRIKLPNGVIVQAAVIVRTPGIMVKARYEVPKYISLETLKGQVAKRVAKIDDYQGYFAISVDETTLNTYIIMITAKFKGLDADYYRGRIFEALLDIVEPLKFST